MAPPADISSQPQLRSFEAFCSFFYVVVVVVADRVSASIAFTCVEQAKQFQQRQAAAAVPHGIGGSSTDTPVRYLKCF